MKNDHNTLFTNRLYELMKERNLTLNRVATLSGMATTTLSNIVNRGSAPRIDTVFRICEGLGVSLTEFFDFPPYNQRPGGSSKKEEESKWEKLGNALTADEKERVRKILSDEK